MQNLSQTEENYLKTIFQLSEKLDDYVSTNSISTGLETSAASVTDMLKKLYEKQLINYEKYKGVSLTQEGRKIATNLIRKHRLWEYFLVEKLEFEWDQVHVIAEQLEHIKSPEMTERLDQFLGHPKYDPHGDPIPDKEGNYTYRSEILLKDLTQNQEAIIVGVKDSDAKFLKFLDEMKMVLGTRIQVLNHFDFDDSYHIKVDDQKELTLSQQVSENLYVKPI